MQQLYVEKKNKQKISSNPHCGGRQVITQGWLRLVYFFSQSFVIIMEKKNIIYKIGGCSVQEMEHERDLCCDVEIRKNNPCELINGMQI